MANGKEGPMDDVTEDQLEDIEALFVQTATAFRSEDGTVTFYGVSPSTLYFADRPRREVGHMPSRRFIDLWNDDGEHSFEADPPNAVLSFLGNDEEPPQDVVVVIRDPLLDGDTLTYAVDVLDGELPRSSGPCSLFIDPLGRPLSPASAAGVRRHERKRVRR
jgi:hypothetical protein